MKIITQNKTTELIKLAHEKCKLIVCMNQNEAHRIHKRATELKLNIHLPITYREFLDGRYSSRFVESILIDNVEYFLQTISKVPIEAISLSVLKEKSNDSTN